MKQLPLVTTLTQTCFACPAQWEGRTSMGQHVYIRYRWGNLEIGVGVDHRSAVLDREHVAMLGDGLDGYLDEADMMKAAATVLRFATISSEVQP